MNISKAILFTLAFMVIHEMNGLGILFTDDIHQLIYGESKDIASSLIKTLYWVKGVISFFELMLVVLFIIAAMGKNHLIPLKTLNSYYFLAIVVGLIFPIMMGPLNWLYNLMFDSKFAIALIPTNINLNSTQLIFLITGVIFGPIAEEYFFRGFIQNKLQKKYTPFISILISSCLFGSWHFLGGFNTNVMENMNLFSIIAATVIDWHQMYITFFGGLILGFIYYKSKSIGPVILMHAIWNLSVYCYVF